MRFFYCVSCTAFRCDGGKSVGSRSALGAVCVPNYVDINAESMSWPCLGVG